MSKYANAVKVRRAAPSVWRADCPACGDWGGYSSVLSLVYRWAVGHAATCPDLHWANWAAACRSCKSYGRVAPACPVCLGYGWVREREGLE